VSLTTHFHLVLKLRINWAMILLSLYVFMLQTERTVTSHWICTLKDEIYRLLIKHQVVKLYGNVEV
jgi:hypothetical protein